MAATLRNIRSMLRSVRLRQTKPKPGGKKNFALARKILDNYSLEGHQEKPEKKEQDMAAPIKDIVTQLQRGPFQPYTRTKVPSAEANAFADEMMEELLGKKAEETPKPDT
ncbi:MAG: hypothetical protein ACI9H6_000024 [Patiriisocius sp.]|jgi:hypothetical protein